ncbi:hypothetical protein Belba_2354 [Belliella baltica DSM 15883]|uniref:Uncharacterized protein n=1 Tax=Belliella baltica (strain DSM 15883 / CIP 108006 / LMG 21964 / BA134) TaxID=866536 RepID=I3Z6P6_BELBD|nr:hypothetical protein Belba_2354 [Belliella baltica DSM 15883]
MERFFYELFVKEMKLLNKDFLQLCKILNQYLS